jgi:hypothetical protein
MHFAVKTLAANRLLNLGPTCWSNPCSRIETSAFRLPDGQSLRGHWGGVRANIHSFGSPTLSHGGQDESNHTAYFP